MGITTISGQQGGAGGGASTAAEVSYDNTTSGLTATNAQAAIDEIGANLGEFDKGRSETITNIKTSANIEYVGVSIQPQSNGTGKAQTSSIMSISTPISLKYGDTITMYGKTGSSGGVKAMFISPNNTPLTSSDDSRVFIAVGDNVTSSGNTTSYTASYDCHIIVECLTSFTASMTLNITKGARGGIYQSLPLQRVMINPKVDFNKSELRILDIGNSYTQDSTIYLQDLVTASGIDASKICHYRFIYSGGSFKDWYSVYNSNNTKKYYYLKTFGGLNCSESTETGQISDNSLFINALTDHKWDIIVIHQASDFAPYYDQFKSKSDSGYLTELLRVLRIKQPQASIGTLLIHSYMDGYSSNLEQSSLERWKKIAQSTLKLSQEYDMDFVVPYGTAIENLRQTSYNNEYDLTRDGSHLGFGLARYTANCCYFESLIARRYGISVYGNSATHDANPSSSGDTSTYPSSNIAVTNDNKEIAQLSAILACNDMYNINNPTDITL